MVFNLFAIQEGWTEQAIKFFNGAKAEVKETSFDKGSQEKKNVSTTLPLTVK
jgi:hypothetical protein